MSLLLSSKILSRGSEWCPSLWAFPLQLVAVLWEKKYLS